jgi:hypothetical protein
MSKWSRASGPALIGSALMIASACGSKPPPPGFANPEQPGSGVDSGSGATHDASMSSGDDSSVIESFGDGSGVEEVGLGDAGCATATAKATKTPVYLLFILDGSESMTQNNKWSAATQALAAIFADMQKQADPGLGAGLIVFSDTLDRSFYTATGPGPYPEPGIDVPIDFVSTAQVTALDARLAGSPRNGTPTGTVLQGGYGELETYMALAPLPPGGQKVLVLITDGVPTDNCAPSGAAYTANACVIEAGQESKRSPPSGPILSFVIGTGVFPSADLTNFDPNFLGNLAQAGGTGPAGCNPNENTTSTDLCYFEVDPTQGTQTQTEQAFEAAINAIRGQVLSCTFPLTVNAEAGMLDPTKVNVTVDGMTIPQSATDGWTYDNPADPTAIVLNGTACTGVKDDPTASVQIVLGCATIMAQ